MNNAFYNHYHKKNTKVQEVVINDKNFTYHPFFKLFDEYIAKKSKILDLGCGVGTLDFYLAQKGHDVTAVDISSRAIKLAEQTNDNLLLNNRPIFICSEIENLKLKEKFDVIICLDVIEHLKNHDVLFLKINHFLKVGGIVIISTPLLSAPLYKLGLLKNFDKKVGHLRRYSIISLSSILEKNNFLILKQVFSEGLLRNLVFTDLGFGWVVRFLKWPIYVVFNFIDYLFIKIFGPSSVQLVIKKA